VGAVAYFLLAGTDVFDGKSVIEVCSQHLYQQPNSLRKRGVAVFPEFDAVVLGCLEKDPNRRPQTVVEVREQIEACPVEPWDREAALRGGGCFRPTYTRTSQCCRRPRYTPSR
jgi:eukaryotic-like serine/threonine-protein kinase